MALPFRPSATRIELFFSCARRWAFQELYRIPTGDTAEALEIGTAMHRQIELYLRDGRPFDFAEEVHGIKTGELALSGLEHLPAPKTPGMLIEHPFDWKLGGMPFQGTKDLEWQYVAEVWDHKTCADLKWAKTPAELVTGIQSATYAAENMARLRSSSCNLKWIYYSKKKPHRSLPVLVQVTSSDVAPAVSDATRALEAMHDIASRHLDPLSLPPNAESCNAYNKQCPYTLRCNLTAQEKWKSIMSQSREEFLANMRKQRAAAGGAAGAPAINPPPAPGAPPPPPGAAPPPPASSHPWDAPGVTFNPPGSRVGAGATHYLIPGATAWTDAPANVPAPPPPPAPPAAPPPPPPPGAPAEAPKRRGRPPKNAAAAPPPPAPGAADDAGDVDPFELLMKARDLIDQACAIMAEEE